MSYSEDKYFPEPEKGKTENKSEVKMVELPFPFCQVTVVPQNLFTSNGNHRTDHKADAEEGLLKVYA